MQNRFLIVVVIALFAALSACGGCDEDAQHIGQTPTDTSHHDADADPGDGFPNDGSPPGDGGTDASAQDIGDASAHDIGDASAHDIGDSGGEWTPEDGCGNAYQRICDGACVNIKINAEHCGACDAPCDDEKVCSGGMCANECLGTETICGRACVQTASDNDHCGACDNPCGEGLGCNNGVCVPAAVYPAPAQCRGGGLPIDLEGQETDSCAGEVAETNFRWAMCACESVNITAGGLVTDAFDSLQGPYIPGILGGSVGMNSNFSCNPGVDIGGSLWVANGRTLSVGSLNTVHMDVMAGGTLNVNGSLGLDILENASVRTNISPGGGGGSVRVVKQLTVPEGVNVPAGVTYADLVNAPVDIAPPCKCAPDELLPIAGYVEARRLDNDNDLIGLDPALLTGPTDLRRLDLPCGNYYLDGINIGSDMTIVAHGRTGLFIQGNVNAARLTILASPDAELDVVISGNLSAAGLTFGSPAFPAATRLYLGGSDKLVLTENVNIGGFVYVYPGEIRITNDIEVFGGLFANEFNVNGVLTVHYDRQILRAGETCREPVVDPDPDPDQDAGFDTGPQPDTGPEPDTGTDPDAGTDPDPPQCLGLDGVCTGDGDCCAPLVCDQGRCAAARCRVGGESCVYSSDCCSLICAYDENSNTGVCIVN